MQKRKTKTKMNGRTNVAGVGVGVGRSVRLGKKRSRSRPSQKMKMEKEKDKCPCLLACVAGDDLLVYCFNLADEKTKRKRNFCQRCCVELYGGEEENKDKPNEKEKQPGVRLITPAKSRFTPNFGTTVVVGTVVYVLGGAYADPENRKRCLFSPKVFFFDMNHPERGWIEGPEMLSPRWSSKAVAVEGVAVEGKIYVFGGINNTYGLKMKKEIEEATAGGPWAEVFDPVVNKWEPLPPPPKATTGLGTEDLRLRPVVVSGSPLEGKKILLSCCNYMYLVNCKTWEEFCFPTPFPRLGGNLTSDGKNTLYWTSHFVFYTFNLKTMECNSGKIEGYDVMKYRYDLSSSEPTLLHLGRERFCFLTLKEGLPGGRTKVRCAEFRVHHQGGFQASLVCRESYMVDQPLDEDIIYGFVL